jgi:hypothetical protein
VEGEGGEGLHPLSLPRRTADLPDSDVAVRFGGPAPRDEDPHHDRLA